MAEQLTIANLTQAIRDAVGERPPANDLQKEINNFKRKPPSFDVGIVPFAQFKLDFILAAEQSGFRELEDTDSDAYKNKYHQCLKGLLYQCLVGTARAMAGRRMYPASDECASLTIDEYSDRLLNLFDSRHESDAAKMEFKQRKQQKFESPMLYVTDKTQLYDRAYPPAQRDLTTLCDELTAGLLNKHIQASLREFEATSRESYEARLRFLANAQHKRMLAKEIPFAEGVALHSASMSYLQNQPKHEHNIKSEPNINTMNADAATGRGQCFWCKEKGHFLAKCPRRLAGIARSVNVLDGGNGGDGDQGESDEAVQAFTNSQETINAKKNNRKKWRRFQTKKDANGIQYLLEYSDEEDEPAGKDIMNGTDTTSPEDIGAVNTLASPEYDFEEMTNDFLGL